MNPEFKRVKDIFLAALEKESAADREAYLSEACASAPAMRRQVDALLHRHEQAGSFLQFPSPDSPPSSPLGGVPLGTGSEVRGAAAVNEPITERPGTIIGQYKLMEQIGEGGMGLVFVAEQQQPVRRRVALKVIKPGMDTRTVIGRFEAERQALALMDHPNIAQVHDGGVTPSGRPYFVMELVKGVPITQYCDDNRLTTRERLELFVHICGAVQHAHHKGIIHRDIKPTNVMVVSHDGKPVVKVIDFGVAKSIGQQLTDKTVYTQFVQLVGTPMYMSPEQAGESGLDVDTRSDIYSLGVLLYELLTGTTPFNRERLKEASYEEIRRILREEEPPKPSTRISTLGKAASTVSTQRKSDPTQLRQLIRGELDWIVMNCLEKDRNRRYETANGLAMDVQRYLHDEPVLACPPSAGYRFRKFARKYRTALRIVAVLVLFLVLGAAVSIWQAIRATHAETQALQAEGRALEDRDRAEKSFHLARDAVDHFFTKVSQSPELSAHGMEKFRKELLQSSRDFHRRFIDEQFDTPAVRYDLALAYHQLTDISRELGDSAAAEEASSKATALLQELAAAHPDVPEYQRDLAASHAALGRLHMNTTSWDKAESAYQQALTIQDNQARAYPGAPEYQYALAKTCSDLVVVHSKQDRGDLCATMCRRTQETLSRLLQENQDNPRVSEYKKLLAATLRNLGEEYLIRDLLDKAETPLKEAQNTYQELAKSQDLPEYWQGLARSQAQRGMVYRDRPGAGDQAEELQKQALEIFKKLTNEHPLVPEYAYDYGRCYSAMGQTADHAGHYGVALDRYDKSIEIMQELVGKDFKRARPALLDSRIHRAITLAKKGDHARATGEAEAIARHQKDLQATAIYNIACAFAQSSETVQRDSNRPATEQLQLKVLYAEKAMDFLHRAVAKGWTKGYELRRLTKMKDDPDLKPLQDLPGFKKLLADLEAKEKESGTRSEKSEGERGQ